MPEYFTKIFFPNKVKVAHRVSYSSYNSAWSPMWQTPFSTLIVPIKHLASLITACADYIRKAVIRFFFSPKWCSWARFAFILYIGILISYSSGNHALWSRTLKLPCVVQQPQIQHIKSLSTFSTRKYKSLSPMAPAHILPFFFMINVIKMPH